ncbi:peptidase dimerization domain-containing protein [Streptomyces sp. NPDC050485]|uniref:peptidase dimerization domain-containing protein n=1 Tax=Streptomyces sp. NPDC050485 TaxID=3365617 RepID=UPI00378AB156
MSRRAWTSGGVRLRGLAACVVELRALEGGVHSGSHGIGAPDALTMLCRQLATLHDEQGNVAVEGLATAVPPGAGPSEAEFRAEAGLLEGAQLLGSGSIAERIWAKPAATVLAIDAPPVATSAPTLTPVARAKVGLRVAPGDDALKVRKALARHLRHHTPWGLQVTVVGGGRTAVRHRCVRPGIRCRTKGLRRGIRKRRCRHRFRRLHPLRRRVADAYPQAAILISSAGADAGSRAHGADESLHLADFERACLAETLLLAELTR